MQAKMKHAFGTDLLSRIGHTPLLRLAHFDQWLSRDVRIFAKAEFANPGGSVKDRPAKNMVLEAINTSMIDPAGAITALSVALASDTPLESLAALLDEQASPPGILNAIGNAAVRYGYIQTDSSTLFASIELAVQAGVPPGLVVRTAKDALREGLSPEEQIALLVELLADGETSPGNAGWLCFVTTCYLTLFLM